MYAGKVLLPRLRSQAHVHTPLCARWSQPCVMVWYGVVVVEVCEKVRNMMQKRNGAGRAEQFSHRAAWGAKRHVVASTTWIGHG